MVGRLLVDVEGEQQIMAEFDDDVERNQRKMLLDSEIKACRRCRGLNIRHTTESAPGWGSLNSAVAIVGQSLCEQCMAPQEPFYEGSGSLLNRCFGKVPIDKAQLFISNVVHCHPPGNRASHDHEIVNCSAFLHRELEIVRPSLVIGLGEDAKRVLSFFYPSARQVGWPFTDPKNVRSKIVPCLLFATHPSSVKRKHDADLESTYVDSLTRAIRWAIAKGPLNIAPRRTSM